MELLGLHRRAPTPASHPDRLATARPNGLRPRRGRWQPRAIARLGAREASRPCLPGGADRLRDPAPHALCLPLRCRAAPTARAVARGADKHMLAPRLAPVARPRRRPLRDLAAGAARRLYRLALSRTVAAARPPEHARRHAPRAILLRSSHRAPPPATTRRPAVRQSLAAEDDGADHDPARRRPNRRQYPAARPPGGSPLGAVCPADTRGVRRLQPGVLRPRPRRARRGPAAARGRAPGWRPGALPRRVLHLHAGLPVPARRPLPRVRREPRRRARAAARRPRGTRARRLRPRRTPRLAPPRRGRGPGGHRRRRQPLPHAGRATHRAGAHPLRRERAPRRATGERPARRRQLPGRPGDRPVHARRRPRLPGRHLARAISACRHPAAGPGRASACWCGGGSPALGRPERRAGGAPRDARRHAPRHVLPPAALHARAVAAAAAPRPRRPRNQRRLGTTALSVLREANAVPAAGDHRGGGRRPRRAPALPPRRPPHAPSAAARAVRRARARHARLSRRLLSPAPGPPRHARAARLAAHSGPVGATREPLAAVGRGLLAAAAGCHSGREPGRGRRAARAAFRAPRHGAWHRAGRRDDGARPGRAAARPGGPHRARRGDLRRPRRNGHLFPGGPPQPDALRPARAHRDRSAPRARQRALTAALDAADVRWVVTANLDNVDGVPFADYAPLIAGYLEENFEPAARYGYWTLQRRR